MVGDHVMFLFKIFISLFADCLPSVKLLVLSHLKEMDSGLLSVPNLGGSCWLALGYKFSLHCDSNLILTIKIHIF